MVLDKFVGRKINSAHFRELARENRDHFIIYNDRYMDNEKFVLLFGITPRQLRIWDYDGICMSIYVHLHDETISSISVLKYREVGGGHGRTGIRELRPTMQELRIVRRVLEYVTAGDFGG